MKKSLFSVRKIVGVFAAVFLIAGFLLLDKGISGNVVLNGEYTSNPLSLIGLIIILFSAILTAYVIIKDNSGR